MQKAVIKVGGKQYLVAEGDELLVEKLPETKNTKLELVPLLVFDGKTATVGRPEAKDYKVTAEKSIGSLKGPKIKVVKFKAKKRVHRTSGHRQNHTLLKITKIGK